MSCYISYAHKLISEITGNIKEDLDEFTRYVALGSLVSHIAPYKF